MLQRSIRISLISEGSKMAAAVCTWVEPEELGRATWKDERYLHCEISCLHRHCEGARYRMEVLMRNLAKWCYTVSVFLV